MADYQQAMTSQTANQSHGYGYAPTAQENFGNYPSQRTLGNTQTFQTAREDDGMSFYQKMKITKSQANLQKEGLTICSTPVKSVNQIANPKLSQAPKTKEKQAVSPYGKNVEVISTPNRHAAKALASKSAVQKENVAKVS